jgi:hypothetical protein
MREKVTGRRRGLLALGARAVKKSGGHRHKGGPSPSPPRGPRPCAWGALALHEGSDRHDQAGTGGGVMGRLLPLLSQGDPRRGQRV